MQGGGTTEWRVSYRGQDQGGSLQHLEMGPIPLPHFPEVIEQIQ